jgi:phospholipase C
MKRSPVLTINTLFLLAGCAQSLPTNLPSSMQLAPAPSPAGAARRVTHASSPISHIVIIVQENRTVDNLFQSLPGANTQSYGRTLQGRTVHLQPEALTAPYDLSHVHADWVTDYNNGGMNGFEDDRCKGSCPNYASYAYVPQDEVQPYYSLAETYTFADNMFATDEGPSFPSHQYLVSGTSAVSETSTDKAADNPEDPAGDLVGGCDSPQGTLVGVIDPEGREPASLKTFPCFQREALMNEMDTAGVSWKYYQATPGAGLFNAVDAIYSIWSNQYEMAEKVITPPSQVLTDIANGQLADVVWVTPTQADSDHPKVNDGSGPSWVSSIVNAVGGSPYWTNTAILILWDDWGGFYDHVSPTIYNSYELGFRVPLIVVSPYAKQNYISHVQHEFGSILKFTEETFGLPSLGTTDERADDLSDCFNFSQRPRVFKRIRAKYPASYFYHLPSVEPND